jgi:hypothetical protein
MDHSQSGTADGQKARLKKDVAARLRQVCAAMPESEFDRLVDQIVSINLKYLGERSSALFRSPAASDGDGDGTPKR